MKKRIFNLYFYKSLANTNNEIKRLDKEENFSRINLGLFSLNQKFGKGRSGNIWISKKGDLTCSFLINKTFDVKKIGQINILVSWCLLTTLKYHYSDQNFKFKWPNDIFLNNKKLAGILIETNIKSAKINYILIGLGINFVSSPKNLSYPAISISEFSTNINPLSFFLKFTDYLFNSFFCFEQTNFSFISENLSKRFLNLKNIIHVKQDKEVFSGKFIKIDDSGSLVLEKENKLVKFTYGNLL